MVPSSISASTYGILQALSVVPSFMLVHKYGILSPGVQPLSMLPPKVGSQPTKFTMPPVASVPAMFSKDQKRF